MEKVLGRSMTTTLKNEEYETHDYCYKLWQDYTIRSSPITRDFYQYHRRFISLLVPLGSL